MPSLQKTKKLLLIGFLSGTSVTALAQSNPPVPYLPAPVLPQQTAPQSDIDRPWPAPLNNTQHQANDTQKTEEDKPSALEDVYAKRVQEDADLKQFGYDLFNQHDEAISDGRKQDTAPLGAVQDNFILGTGDELLITFTGQRTDQDTYKVDTRGMLIIKEFAPIPAAGRTIEQVRNAVNAQAEAAYNTKAFISLSSVRQINVLVIGNVGKPGRKTLNAFHSAIDAIEKSGGINKDGSLRRIKRVRNGKSTIIDLYDILLGNNQNIDLTLKDGDRLIIPPIGPTVAVTGAVKRSGIFEIKPQGSRAQSLINNASEKLSLNQMLSLAGGVLTQGQNRFMKSTLSNNGKENIAQITDPFLRQFDDGAILNVLKGEDVRQGTIELIGQTTAAGTYDINKHKTLASLIASPDMISKDIYAPIGVIKRWNKTQLTYTFVNFSIRSVLNKETDIRLLENDSVILLSNNYIQGLKEKTYSDTERITNTKINIKGAPEEIQNDQALKLYLKDRFITLRGAVHKPASYPIADGVSLSHIIATAGGLTSNADRKQIEIISRPKARTSQIEPVNFNTSHSQHRTIDLTSTSAETIILRPGDSVNIKQKFEKVKNNAILVAGEVFNPGEYDLMPGEKVSDIIRRAGGLKDTAYPAGAIFSRESARRTEEMQFRAAAVNMKQRLAAAVQNDKNAPDSTQIELVQTLAKQLENIEAVGRITVETDPVVLDMRPELDMLLEKGDRIYIPKRPLTVRVTGEVLSPATLQFTQDKSPRDYIMEAGGFSYFADKKRAFLLHPDGSAQPLKVSAWNHTALLVPPGSAIVVPRDPKPFDFIESAKDIGQILTSIAITSVFIDEIQDD